MKKIINFRPIFYTFIAFGLGIIFARPIFRGDIFTILFVSALSLALLTFAIIYKKIVRFFALFAIFAVGFCAFFVSLNSFNVKDYGAQPQVITGRVGICNNYENSQIFILENVTLNGEKITSKISVSVYGGGYETGNVIGFNATLEKVDAFTLGKFNSYNYKYNIKYKCKPSGSITLFELGSLKVNEQISLWVKNALDENMSSDIASVAYASLLGDKSYIDSEIKSSFSVSGMAHMLAVSGLHIGFVVSILTFILKKLKLKNYINLIICGSILLFYCYLCGFSVSVVRATIMYLVFALSGVLKQKYDKLNSLGLAGLIILMFNPLMVFDAGFLLSFASVFCIFLFAPMLYKTFKKWHFPEFFASTLSVMLAVQFGLLPLMSRYFSTFSIFSLFANFISIPIFEIAFSMLFLMTPLVILLQFLGFILKLPEILLFGIIFIAKSVASLKLGIFNFYTLSTLAVVAIYSGCFIGSHFANIKKINKMWTSVCLLAFVLLLGVAYTTANSQAFALTTLNSYNSNVFAIEHNGQIYCIGDFDKYSLSATADYLNNIKRQKADVLVSLNDYELDYESIANKVYLTEQLIGQKEIKNISFEIIKNNQTIIGVCLTADDNSIFIAQNNVNNQEVLQICNSLGNNFKIIVLNDEIPENFQIPNNIQYLLVDNGLYENGQSDLQRYAGNYTIDLSSEKIGKVWGLN